MFMVYFLFTNIYSNIKLVECGRIYDWTNVKLVVCGRIYDWTNVLVEYGRIYDLTNVMLVECGRIFDWTNVEIVEFASKKNVFRLGYPTSISRFGRRPSYIVREASVVVPPPPSPLCRDAYP